MTIACGEAPPHTSAASALTPSTQVHSSANSKVEDEAGEEEEGLALIPVSHTNHNESGEDR